MESKNKKIIQEAKQKSEFSVGAVILTPGSSKSYKTGGWRSSRPVIDEKKCTKCMICWTYCPDNAISTDIKFDYEYCKGCAICAKNCPVKCITMVEEQK